MPIETIAKHKGDLRKASVELARKLNISTREASKRLASAIKGNK